ncbi:MAG: hypothetical protein KDA96_10385, partial [Planctomycetaceae bacterium]|nr:hypothetical protein [Planctomycetaceae bacterium]
MTVSPWINRRLRSLAALAICGGLASTPSFAADKILPRYSSFRAWPAAMQDSPIPPTPANEVGQYSDPSQIPGGPTPIAAPVMVPQYAPSYSQPYYEQSPYVVASPGHVISADDTQTLRITGGATWLRFRRDTDLDSTVNVINGPDANLLQFPASDLDFSNGYRVFVNGSGGGLKIEAVYSDLGEWKDRRAGTLTAPIVFDDNIGGAFVGPNSIDAGIYFDSLHIAADGGLGGEGDEVDGLGPAAAFPADALPTFEIYYESQLRTFELNLLSDDPCSNWQLGLGYRNLQLDEVAGAAFAGTYRAIDVAAPNGGLSHATLTGVGGLTYLGTTGNGFEDETGNASGNPDQFSMSHIARTSNQLNGIQGIFSSRIIHWNNWSLNGTVKTGVYHNRALGSVTETYRGLDTGVG